VEPIDPPPTPRKLRNFNESVQFCWDGYDIEHVPLPDPWRCARKKNGFVTATRLGTTDNIFVGATKNFAAATKRFVD